MYFAGIFILIVSVLVGAKFYNNFEEKELQEQHLQQSQINNELQLSLANTYQANQTWANEINQLENPFAIHTQHILRNKRIVLKGSILDIYTIPSENKIAIKIDPDTEYFEHELEFVLTTQDGAIVKNILSNKTGKLSDVIVVAEIKETEFQDGEADKLLVNGEVLAIESIY